METKAKILAELHEASAVLDAFKNDSKNLDSIENAAFLMADCFRKGGKVISCGNGGSHCDAMHFAEELSGRFRENRKPLAAMAISDASHITCVGNDFGFEYIFSRYVEGVGNTGDILMAISTSGNSQNVINAAQVAKEVGMKVVSLTGKDGGKLAALSDVEIRVPHNGYADRVQEVHIKVIHIIIQLIEEKLFSSQSN